VPLLPRPQVFIAHIGDEAREEAIKLASRLRQADIGIVVAAGNKSLKAQLRQANTPAVRHAVIIGEQEVRTGTVILRDMVNARQKTVSPAELPGLLK
jgi:histidyl-tRNA synthetase